MQRFRRLSLALTASLAVFCVGNSVQAQTPVQEVYPSAIYAFPFSLPGSVSVEIAEVSRDIPGFEGETTVHVVFTVHNGTERRVELEKSDLRLDWVQDERLPELDRRPHEVKGETEIEADSSSRIHAYFDVDIGVGPEPDDLDVVRVEWELEIGSRLTVPDTTTFVAYRTGPERAYYVAPEYYAFHPHARYHHSLRGVRLHRTPLHRHTGHPSPHGATRLRVVPR